MSTNDLPPLFFEVEASSSKQTNQVRQVIAHALIEKLQHWCMQIFWMTVFCVMNCVGDDEEDLMKSKKSKKSSEQKRKTSLTDIEQKMLRHLTSPYLSSPLRPVHRQSKRRPVLSRPPSPQLFDIAEEE
ncbi:unnamed protein product [Caenorhabditis angaria]|uniref:Uncharacterized protein n=1 Tax=Caenorhabditis angaria TaxID=860376 RepID=A0A9P1MZD5_9PELO|nr:unnamed protein product [Caenorhabditis angaria]